MFSTPFKYYSIKTAVILVLIIVSYGSQAQVNRDSLKLVIKTSKVDTTKINTLEVLVRSFLPTQLDSVLHYQKQLKQLSIDYSNVEGSITALSLSARVHYLRGNYKMALDDLKLAQELAQPLKNETINAPIIRKLIMNQVKLKQYKEAIETGESYFEQVSKDSISIPVLNRTYIWLGMAYLEVQEKEKTLQLYNNVSATTPKTIENIGLYGNMAIILSNKGDIVSALGYIMPGLEIIETKPLTSYKEYEVAKNVSRFYRTAGGIYLKREEYIKALEAYDNAIIVSKQASSHFNTITSLYSQSVIYQELGQDKESLDVLLEGYDISKKQNINARFYHFAIKLGYAYLKLEKYDEALRYFDKGVDYALEKKNNLWLANAYASLGEAYLKNEQFQKAKDFLIKSKKTYDNQKNYTLDYADKLLYHKSLYVVDSTLQNYKSSLKNYEQYIIARDSVNDSKRQDKIIEIETKYETEKKEKAIVLLTKENEIQKLREIRNRNEKIAFIAGLSLLFGLLLFGYRSYKNKTKTLDIITAKNKAIAQKSEENQLLVQEIHHRVKNNLQIISSLLAASSHKLQASPEKAMNVLMESQNKIKSIAILHQKLYQSNNFVSVSAIEYFDNLLENLESSYTNNEYENPSISKHIDDVEIPMSLAVPLGLITNELVTNSYKYAFTAAQKNNEIYIAFGKANKEATYQLTARDNGIGLSSENTANESFGLEMVRGLVAQYQGEIVLNKEKGLSYLITIKAKETG